jgi:DNA mismatch endonuclease (patch repair protein)
MSRAAARDLSQKGPRRMAPETRLRVMRSIKSKNTRPELAVRRALREKGIRYRIHVRTLPGSPDIVLRGSLRLIQVHGCLFHGHTRCPLARVPQSAYWKVKIARNKDRDARTTRALRALGWSVLIIWECETRDLQRLDSRLRGFLED